MTLEQFEKAQEVRDEIETTLNMESLFLNWGNAHENASVLMTVYGKDSWRIGETCNKVDTYSLELKNRLVQTCRDYYHELNKRFDEI